jgi:hypothetical protein
MLSVRVSFFDVCQGILDEFFLALGDPTEAEIGVVV